MSLSGDIDSKPDSKNYCSVCQGQIQRIGGFVQCNLCKQPCHVSCSGLVSPRYWNPHFVAPCCASTLPLTVPSDSWNENCSVCRRAFKPNIPSVHCNQCKEQCHTSCAGLISSGFWNSNLVAPCCSPLLEASNMGTWYCAVCRKTIPRKAGSVQCNACKEQCHVHCSGLTSRKDWNSTLVAPCCAPSVNSSFKPNPIIQSEVNLRPDILDCSVCCKVIQRTVPAVACNQCKKDCHLSCVGLVSSRFWNSSLVAPCCAYMLPPAILRQTTNINCSVCGKMLKPSSTTVQCNQCVQHCHGGCAGLVSLLFWNSRFIAPCCSPVLSNSNTASQPSSHVLQPDSQEGIISAPENNGTSSSIGEKNSMTEVVPDPAVKIKVEEGTDSLSAVEEKNSKTEVVLDPAVKIKVEAVDDASRSGNSPLESDEVHDALVRVKEESVVLPDEDTMLMKEEEFNETHQNTSNSKIIKLEVGESRNQSASEVTLGSVVSLQDEVDSPYGHQIHTKEKPRTDPLIQLNDSQTQPSGEEPSAAIEMIFSCKYCDKMFPQKKRLTEHQRVHTRKHKLHYCKFCNRAFGQRGTLTRHEEIHTGIIPLDCNHCEKKFSRKSSLMRHLSLHAGQKLFQCPYCEKTFSQKGHLSVHERVHTGEKPYCCIDCGKTFHDKSNLKTHERVHTGEKPYCCTDCGKAFMHKNLLVVHCRVHTGERPFQCAHCEKTFKSKPTLKGHIELHKF